MKYCIANWKMNMNGSEAFNYLEMLGNFIYKNKEISEDVLMIICPPFTLINWMSEIISDGRMRNVDSSVLNNAELGVQNINPNDSGAYTGEISIDMIKDCSVSWLIAGHSERRSLFNESNEFINLKVKASLNNGIRPILCIGETSEEREAGKTEEVLYNQLKDCLRDVSCIDEDFLIAYEPVWAIGTGKNANNDMIKSANDMTKSIIKELKYDIQKPKILYGGSVNNNNAENLSKICNLDGFLIGGASLDAKQFYDIYNTLKGE